MSTSLPTIFTRGFVTAAPAADNPFFAFLPFQAAKDGKNNFAIRDIAFITNAATVADVGLVALTANGTPDPAGTLEAYQENRMAGLAPPPDISVTQIITAWTVAPTRDANIILKRVRLPAVEGSSVSWSWDEIAQVIGGETNTHLGAVALWNLGAVAGPVLTVTVRFNEGGVLSPAREAYGLRPTPV